MARIIYSILAAVVLALPLWMACTSLLYVLQHGTGSPRFVTDGDERYIKSTSAIGFIQFPGYRFRYKFNAVDALLILIGLALLLFGFVKSVISAHHINMEGRLNEQLVSQGDGIVQNQQSPSESTVEDGP